MISLLIVPNLHILCYCIKYILLRIFIYYCFFTNFDNFLINIYNSHQVWFVNIFFYIRNNRTDKRSLKYPYLSIYKWSVNISIYCDILVDERIEPPVKSCSVFEPSTTVWTWPIPHKPEN